jgi:ABC-2 type transport system permease protein
LGTIYILWLRQLKRYFRNKARIVGSLGQPMLFLVALSVGFGPIYAKAGDGSYIQFLAPGIMAMTILFTSIFSGMEIIWDRQFGFLKETLVAPVPRTKIMIGRTLGGATIAVFQALIVLAISTIAGFKPDIFMIPLAILFMILTALYSPHLGLQWRLILMICRDSN